MRKNMDRSKTLYRILGHYGVYIGFSLKHLAATTDLAPLVSKGTSPSSER